MRPRCLMLLRRQKMAASDALTQKRQPRPLPAARVERGTACRAPLCCRVARRYGMTRAENRVRSAAEARCAAMFARLRPAAERQRKRKSSAPGAPRGAMLMRSARYAARCCADGRDARDAPDFASAAATDTAFHVIFAASRVLLMIRGCARCCPSVCCITPAAIKRRQLFYSVT